MCIWRDYEPCSGIGFIAVSEISRKRAETGALEGGFVAPKRGPIHALWRLGRRKAPELAETLQPLRKSAPSIGLGGCARSPSLTMLQRDSLIIREKTGKFEKSGPSERAKGR